MIRMVLSGGGRGWLLKVLHFEMDTKASRERSSSQTALLQSQPSPRHYGNPFLVRVTAEETVGVRFCLAPCCQFFVAQQECWCPVCARARCLCPSTDVVWGGGACAVRTAVMVACTGQDLKRKVRDALEEQYKKRKDAESNEPSIADWALWKFANSPPEELTDDSQFPVSPAAHPRSRSGFCAHPRFLWACRYAQVRRCRGAVEHGA